MNFMTLNKNHFPGIAGGNVPVLRSASYSLFRIACCWLNSIWRRQADKDGRVTLYTANIGDRCVIQLPSFPLPFPALNSSADKIWRTYHTVLG